MKKNEKEFTMNCAAWTAKRSRSTAGRTATQVTLECYYTNSILFNNYVG